MVNIFSYRALVLLSAAGAGMIPWASGAEEVGRYQGPCALAASKDGRTLYVADEDARALTWVELPGGRVIRRVALPAAPSGLALSPDGTRLIVTCAAARSTVAMLDAVSGKLLAAIPAGHTAMGPAISPDGRRLYVCNRFDGDVSVIDMAAFKELARIAAVREPVAAAVTPDGRAVLVAGHLPNTRSDGAFKGDVSPSVMVIDTRTHAATAIALPHGSSGVRGLCIAPDGGQAFVTHILGNFEMVPSHVDGGWVEVNVVSMIDVRGRTLLRTVGMDENERGAGNPWDVACTADGKWVCVSLAGTHELCVIERSTLLGEDAASMSPMMGVWPIYTSMGDSLWRRIKLPGKGPRGLAVVGSKIYAAQYFSDTVAMADLRAPDAPVAAIVLGPPPQLTPQRRGQLLFHDATICYQQWLSCASCHPDGRVDGLNWDLLNDGEGNPKNTKSLLLAHRTPPAMWEGVRSNAEEAVRSGLRHILFADRPEEEAAAIDAYLKSLRAAPSPHLVDGRLSPAAERGRKLFCDEQIGCCRCHRPPFYSDGRSHDVGSRSLHEQTDHFYTPPLVEVWRTAPYLHDGRYNTVRELLVEGKHGLRGGRRAELREQELHDLVEFVLSL
jgi:YVTN family beta-propeller protein